MASGGVESSRSQAAFHLAAIASLTLLCGVIYSNTLAVPFVYDDSPNILENEWIRIADLSPSSLWQAGMESRCTRPFAYTSFALNYYFGEFAVRGYHLVNIAVHGLAGLLVYWLGLHLFRKSQRLRPDGGWSLAPEWSALLAAGIFVAHPIQTQSVTYVVQRMSSGATLFCLLAFVLFILGREREGLRRGGLWLAAALAWFVALGTKQTAMPLPLLAFLYEWYFHRDLSFGWLRERWALLLATLGVMGAVSIYFLVSDHEISYDLRNFSLAERLLTQPRVVLRYLGLLLFPHPGRLNLVHDVPISHSLLDPPTTLLAPLVLLAIFVWAVRAAPRFRLLSFCIVWFFLNLAIESSFISLELMFEHRLYLPMVGFSLGAASLVGMAAATGARRARWVAAMGVGLVALLSLGAHQRNAVWQSELGLWQDVVAKSPKEYTALNNLGVQLRHAGRLDEAEAYLLRSVESNPEYFRAWWNLAAVASDRDDDAEMIRLLRRAGSVEPLSQRANPYIATAHRRLAKLFMERGKWSEALVHAEEDLRLDPDRALTLMRVAWILATHADSAAGAGGRAVELAERADAMTDHAAPRVLDTLATAYAVAERFDDAARVMKDLLALEVAAGGGREGVIRERLAKYQAAAEGDRR